MSSILYEPTLVRVEDPPSVVVVYRSGDPSNPPQVDRVEQLEACGLAAQAKRVQRESDIAYASQFFYELKDRELRVWQMYLPTEYYDISNYRYDTIPEPAVEEISTANALQIFNQIRIWSPEIPERPPRLDPMAVGVFFTDPNRYFAIARWAESLITIEEAEEIVRQQHSARKKHCGERMINVPGQWIKCCLACGHRA